MFIKFMFIAACTYSFSAGPCIPTSVVFNNSSQKFVFQHSSQDSWVTERKEEYRRKSSIHYVLSFLSNSYLNFFFFLPFAILGEFQTMERNKYNMME